LLLLLAPALHAQEQGRPTPPPKPPAAKPPPPPLSPEDAEVAREMVLLEKLELLKTLELFEPEPLPAKP
jgi:hypothetical protein